MKDFGSVIIIDPKYNAFCEELRSHKVDAYESLNKMRWFLVKNKALAPHEVEKLIVEVDQLMANLSRTGSGL